MLMAIQLILGLGLLVFLHELGHFLFARLFGMRVEKFVIFMDIFDFKLFKFKKGDTEYSIGWLPIGGYVKIAGMVDESMDKEQLAEEPKPDEFRSFAAWKRIVVLLGGVIVNFIVGVTIFSCVLLFGEKEYTPAESLTEGIYAFEAAQEFGLQSGDIITHVNGDKIFRLKDAYTKNIFISNVLTVNRGGETVEVTIPPTFKNRDILLYSLENHSAEIKEVVEGYPAAEAGFEAGDIIKSINEFEVNVFGDIKNTLFNLTTADTLNVVVDRAGQERNLTCYLGEQRALGVATILDIKKEPYSFMNSIGYGLQESMALLGTNVSGLAALATGKIPFTKSVTGPIGIAKIYGSNFDALRFWRITALISLILALTNLIPIPALDGGQILIILVESVIGRELSYKVKMAIQVVGVVLVLGLMLFTVVNDIINF